MRSVTGLYTENKELVLTILSWTIGAGCAATNAASTKMLKASAIDRERFLVQYFVARALKESNPIKSSGSSTEKRFNIVVEEMQEARKPF